MEGFPGTEGPLRKRVPTWVGMVGNQILLWQATTPESRIHSFPVTHPSLRPPPPWLGT